MSKSKSQETTTTTVNADDLINANRKRLDESVQRVNRDRDLPSLIEWGHAASEIGAWLTRNCERLTGSDELPGTVEGFDLTGNLWPFLSAEVFRITAVNEEDLRVVAVYRLTGRGYFPVQPELLKRYPQVLRNLRADASWFDRLLAAVCEKFPEAASPLPVPSAKHDPMAPYMPVGWFKEEFGINPERLRAAARAGTLKRLKIHGEYRYSVPKAMELWPGDVTYFPD